MINLTDKEDRPYKTSPRYHERRVTDIGLCIWQLNKMLRGSGYKITRITGGTSELILIPTGYKKVKLVDDAELSNYLDSTILAPSEKYPIAAIYNGFLQLYPENIQKLDITYLSRPQRPEDGQFWRYEVEDGLPMYNAALSTNLAWSDELFNEIAVRVLSFIGINLRETILSQYSEMKKTQGI